MHEGWTRAAMSRLLPSRRGWTAFGGYLACVLVAAVVALPVVIERAVEGVHFADDLGTFPVDVHLCHDGRSTLDTGIFGKVFWAQTGTLGLGACARATGPPEAGGTLASYVDPAFIKANVQLIDDPRRVVHAYSAEMSDALRDRILLHELVVAIVGGALLFIVVPRRRLGGVPRRPLIVASVLLTCTATAVSFLAAVDLYQHWPGSRAPEVSYPLTGSDVLSFSSPQTAEIASQVKPFIDKNTHRLEARAREYEVAAKASFHEALAARAAVLVPRSDEKIVLAEGDPQGSLVGVHVRTAMYADLVHTFGAQSFAIRTIAGDVTSNGTVAESSYIRQEAKVSGEIPTVAVGGDHDSTNTWKQMTDEGITVPDLDTVDIGDLHVAGANDREHKSLFGGIVTDPTGVSEQQLGSKLRGVVDDADDAAQIVVLHQPDAVAAYLGLDSMDPVTSLPTTKSHRRAPYDDDVADLPPGIVDIGHRHQMEGPWVLWNTDGDEITWTVVDQLGTAGGVENSPTVSRFSTPLSAPLKPLTVRLQYVNTESGLETGYATVHCDLQGRCGVSDRVDVGLPGGQPKTPAELARDRKATNGGPH